MRKYIYLSIFILIIVPLIMVFAPLYRYETLDYKVFVVDNLEYKVRMSVVPAFDYDRSSYYYRYYTSPYRININIWSKYEVQFNRLELSNDKFVLIITEDELQDMIFKLDNLIDNKNHRIISVINDKMNRYRISMDKDLDYEDYTLKLDLIFDHGSGERMLLNIPLNKEKIILRGSLWDAWMGI